MAVNLHPLPEWVIARPIEPETKTASGIYIPDKAVEKTNEAVVKAVGRDVKNVKVNDVVVYKSYSSNDIKRGAENYIAIKEEDILATVK